MTSEHATTIAKRFIQFLETGSLPDGLFAPNIFCDFTLPLWRLQAQGVADAVSLRHQGHPSQGTVPRWRCDPTPTGFVLEVEERWIQDGVDWYCREMFRADLEEDAIYNLSVYCTGDWDSAQIARHANNVKLLRP